jgi:hypothetical protein
MSISQNFPNTRPSLSINFARSQTLDPRITFTRTTSGTRVGPDGYIEVIPADQPRFDFDPVTGECLGLLIEELRTNDIRNSTMQGAVAATPGTSPTYWTMGTSAGGLSREITGVGEENGIPYIDVRWYGTATANPVSYLPFWPDGINTTNSPGTYTSRYTFSSYVKVVSGTVPSSTTFILVMTNADSGSIGLDEYKVSTIISNSSVPTGNLIDNRFALTNTDFSNTNTAYFKPYYQWDVPNGTSFDVTIRIGLPQMEEGSFMTSVIPTSGSTVTRTADNASITGSNFTEWYNPSEGTVYTQFKTELNITNNIWSINNYPATTFGIINNYFRLLTLSNTIHTQYNVAGTNLYPTFSLTSNNSQRVIQSYNINSSPITSTLNGTIGTGSGNIYATSPGFNQLEFGKSVDARNTKSQYTISQLIYYPTALPSNQLVTLTK